MKLGVHSAKKKMATTIATLRFISQTAQVRIVIMTLRNYEYRATDITRGYSLSETAIQTRYVPDELHVGKLHNVDRRKRNLQPVNLYDVSQELLERSGINPSTGRKS